MRTVTLEVDRIVALRLGWLHHLCTRLKNGLTGLVGESVTRGIGAKLGQLARKGLEKEVRMCFAGHVLMEKQNGLVGDMRSPSLLGQRTGRRPWIC